jgi:hypothetical protein
MPDTVEPAGGGRYPSDMESRVAVLEQIARTTTAGLERLERRFDTLDQRMDSFMREQRADFRWLLGIILGSSGALLGVMAHGFRWL